MEKKKTKKPNKYLSMHNVHIKMSSSSLIDLYTIWWMQEFRITLINEVWCLEISLK